MTIIKEWVGIMTIFGTLIILGISTLGLGLAAENQTSITQYTQLIGKDYCNRIVGDNKGDNRLNGTENRDCIDGLGGNDIIHGMGSNDLITGGDGNDRLYGDDGNDLLIGGIGNDGLKGSNGNDFLVGGPGADIFMCGGGFDVIFDYIPGEDRKDDSCERF